MPTFSSQPKELSLLPPQTQFLTYKTKSPNGIRLSRKPDVALRTVRTALARHAMSDLPDRVELHIDDVPTRELYLATKNDDGPSAHSDERRASLRAELGQVSAIQTEAIERFGPGEPNRCGGGSTGDQWRLSWSFDPSDDAYPQTVNALGEFFVHHAAARHPRWPSKAPDVPNDETVLLWFSYYPVWTDPGSQEPLPHQPPKSRRGSRLYMPSGPLDVYFAGKGARVHADMMVPFRRLTRTFATWEASLNEGFGGALREIDWKFCTWDAEWQRPDDGKKAVYLRSDWKEGAASPVTGKWDKLLRQLAGGVRSSTQKADILKRLSKMDRGHVACAAARLLPGLKNAPARDVAWVLWEMSVQRRSNRDYADPLQDRSHLAPAIDILLSNPASAASMDHAGSAVKDSACEPWFLERVNQTLLQKRVPVAVWPFIASAYGHTRADDPEHCLRVLVRSLRRTRPAGSAKSRLTLLKALNDTEQVDLTWPVFAIELHHPPKKMSAERWQREMTTETFIGKAVRRAQHSAQDNSLDALTAKEDALAV